jgi:hypothetical protein
LSENSTSPKYATGLRDFWKVPKNANTIGDSTTEGPVSRSSNLSWGDLYQLVKKTSMSK